MFSVYTFLLPFDSIGYKHCVCNTTQSNESISKSVQKKYYGRRKPELPETHHSPCLNCSFLHPFHKYLRSIYCESLLKLQITAMEKTGGPVFAGLTRHAN